MIATDIARSGPLDHGVDPALDLFPPHECANAASISRSPSLEQHEQNVSASHHDVGNELRAAESARRVLSFLNQWRRVASAVKLWLGSVGTESRSQPLDFLAAQHQSSILVTLPASLPPPLPHTPQNTDLPCGILLFTPWHILDITSSTSYQASSFSKYRHHDDVPVQAEEGRPPRARKTSQHQRVRVFRAGARATLARNNKAVVTHRLTSSSSHAQI
jgi:hypothetical protein